MIEAFDAVDYEALMFSTTLTKDENITIEYVFNQLIGTPKAMAKPTEEEVANIANAILTNYFSENPTPTVKAHEYLKDVECWNVILSNDVQYMLKATKCDNGEYDYRYSVVEDAFSTPSKMTSQSKSKSNSKKGSASCDKFLDEYEDFVDSYVKKYKQLSKKAENGDFSAIVDLAELAEKASDFADECEQWDGEMTEKRAERYLRITMKLSDIVEF